jgi:hypothetical protein
VTIRAHYAAFKGLLTAAPNSLVVNDAESPNLATGLYVTLYPNTGDREPVDLADANPLSVWTIRTTVTGDSLEQVNLGMEKVAARLEGVKPVVAGRTCTRIKKLLSRMAERDDDVDPAKFYAVADWRWTSNPSA